MRKIEWIIVTTYHQNGLIDFDEILHKYIT